MPSYVAVVSAESGLLLGGFAKVTSSRFETKEQADAWGEQCVMTNERAGRKPFKSFSTQRVPGKPEVPADRSNSMSSSEQEYHEDKVRALVDEAAAILSADLNRVEEAWFLRGVVDALTNEHEPPEVGDDRYCTFYLTGRQAAERLDV